MHNLSVYKGGVLFMDVDFAHTLFAEDPQPIQVIEYLDYTTKIGTQVRLSMPAKHSLWGHMLFNSAKYLADFFESNREVVDGKNVLELGAGLGLPSIICAKLGAKITVTDYPEQVLLARLSENLALNNVCGKVEGLLWGRSLETTKFDVIILSDLVFNHSEHFKLLRTCKDSLADNGKIYCAFVSHRPHLADKDMEFFEKAKEFGFNCQLSDTCNMGPMFENDPGDLECRSLVKFFIITINSVSL